MSDQIEPGTALTTAPRQQVAKAKLEADGGGVMAFHPRNIEEAQRYASGMIAGGIVPDCFRVDGKKANEVNAPLVLMGVLKSLEIGFPPQTGIAFLLPINGRFTVWGDGAWALIQRHKTNGLPTLQKHLTTWFWPDGNGGISSGPRLLWKDQHILALDKWPNEVGCEVTMWRRGQDEPYVGTYMVGNARRANLWNNNYKKPWITDPVRMLFNRARSIPMRDGFADALFGLGITEEVRDYTPETKIERRIDNSALDDDGGVPLLPSGQDISADAMTARANAYKAGLVMIQSLEELEAWQTTPDHMALMEEIKRRDEEAFDALVAANARRYQEIEAAERTAQKERDEAADAEENARNTAADYQASEQVSGAADAQATDAKGDLFAGDS